MVAQRTKTYQIYDEFTGFKQNIVLEPMEWNYTHLEVHYDEIL